MRAHGLRPGRSNAGTTIAVTAMLIALAALVLSMGSPSSTAAPTRAAKEEVQLLTTVTGTLEVTADGAGVTIPLDNAAFTQEAGTTIELVTHVTGDFDPTGGNDCSAWVGWDVPGVGSFPDTHMVALGQWMGRSVFGITPVSTDRSLSLQVSTSSFEACQTTEGVVPKYRVGIDVAVLALR